MLFQRSNSYRPPVGRTSRLSSVLPWIFAFALLAVGALPIRQWLHWPHWNDGRSQEFETIWRQAGDLARHHQADVIRTIDGDTFEARVHLASGQDVMTRVRLRGIDAPELKGACPEELRMAETATGALRDLLRQGDVAIYNIGPDKYQGRIVADVATKRTVNVSAALIGAGHVRSYNGGHRNGWCANAARQ
ncbi:thermonuclease family protein [Bradyrhizobium lablabi]|nr:thermonuclease family protein [Bradyrhizobium lablabi]MBR1123316.1 thermonuclease family protein [Bradyrhizobium lablabi]